MNFKKWFHGRMVNCVLLLSVLSVFLVVFKTVEVRKASVEDARVDSIELTLKDQYISSSEMWRLKLYLCDSWLYINKQLSMRLVKVRVRELRKKGETVRGGLVVPDTTITFRSKTVNLFWLVQVSESLTQACSAFVSCLSLRQVRVCLNVCVWMLVWLFQVSKEMWQHAGGGRLYVELLYELIQQIWETWNSDDASHTLTVVFFARGE